MRYRGTHPRTVTSSSLYPNKFFEGTPEEWGLGLEVRSGGGLHSRDGSPSYSQINPGDEWIKTYYLHHRYVTISPTRVKLTIKWFITSKAPEQVAIASPEVPLEFDIQPADVKHLSSLTSRLQERLDHANRPDSADEIEDIIKYLDHTRHSALVTLAWRIIGQYRGAHRGTMIWYVAHYSEDLREADLRLAKLVPGLRLAERMDLARCWSVREPPPTSEAFRVLANSEHIWNRVITYIYFGDKCDQRWKDALFSDLSDLSQPLPESQFSQLLRNLDHEVFAQREKASSQLAAYGERVEHKLKQVLTRPLTPEAKRRVQLTLEEIAIAKEAAEWKPLVEYLSLDGNNERALAILRVLARGAPEASVTKAAMAALNRQSVAR
jgi:hypothetical protein